MFSLTFFHLNTHRKIPLRDITERHVFLNYQDRFATACGLALQGLGLVPFAVNMLPQEKQGFFSRVKGVFSKKKIVAAWGLDIGNSCMKAVRVTFDSEGIPVVNECYHCHYPISDPKLSNTQETEDSRINRLESQAVDVLQSSSLFADRDTSVVFKSRDIQSLKSLSIEGFLHRYEYNGELICIGYPSQNLICTNIALEVDTPEIAAKVIPFEFKNHLPLDEDQFLPNYLFLGSDIGENNSVHQCIHLFSTRISTMENNIELLGKFGIVPNIMTTNHLANLNYSAFLLMSPPVTQTGALEENNFEPSDIESILVCDMGAMGTDLIFYNLKEIIHHYVTIGGDHFTRAIAKTLDIPFERAEGFKRNPLASGHGTEVVEALKPVVRQLVSEVMIRLERFRKNGGNLDKIIVMGSGFQLQGFADYFHKVLETLWKKVT
jgi:Tfp pilus assembly PilM family ATPase